MRLAMIGTGYVGLVSGACLADFGHEVVCVDHDRDKIASILKAEVPIFEPGLDSLIAANSAAGRLRFTTDYASAVANADAIFLAVGTPSRRGDGHAELSFVIEAALQVAIHLERTSVIVIKSTVPVGTGDEVERIVRGRRPDLDITVVSNPEFLREGAALEDFRRPNRIVVGTHDPKAQAVMGEIYRPLYLNQTPMLFTDRRTAELIKYAANAFLATKITFINEIADLCEKVGANVQDVARGMGLDNRIGPKFLHPGPGFGGSCFPKDTLALVTTARECGTSLSILESVISVNQSRKNAMAGRVANVLGGQVQGKTIGILGLTFKPNTDDMRESPSIPLIEQLQAAGALVRAYDPKGMSQARKLLRGVSWCEDPYDCAAGANALVIVTEWSEFRALNLARLREVMGTAVLIDLRNIYRPQEVEKHGFAYCSLGRAPYHLGI